jgi:hypothetical protein
MNATVSASTYNLHRATRRSNIVEKTYFCFFKEEEQIISKPLAKKFPD